MLLRKACCAPLARHRRRARRAMATLVATKFLMKGATVAALAAGIACARRRRSAKGEADTQAAA